MTEHTFTEHNEDRVALIELGAPWVVRASEVAAIVLVFLLVCPPLLILLVVVAVPLLALAAVVAIVASVLALPVFLARHLRGRRAHHTRLVASRLKRVRPIS
jgi:hypothetical protein